MVYVLKHFFLKRDDRCILEPQTDRFRDILGLVQQDAFDDADDDDEPLSHNEEDGESLPAAKTTIQVRCLWAEKLGRCLNSSKEEISLIHNKDQDLI